MVISLQALLRRQHARFGYRRGLTHIQQADYPAAIAAFDRALTHHPRPAQVLVKRGQAHQQLDDLTAALADYEAAIATDPTYAQGYGNRGHIRLAQGDDDGALDDWQTALKLWPAYADASHQQGLLYLQRQDYAAALSSFDQALAASPNLAPAYFHRGNVREQQGDRAGAIQDWELALCNDLTLEAAKEKLWGVQRETRDDQLSHSLQAALNARNLTVKALYRGEQIDIFIYRAVGVGINYMTLPDLIRQCLVPRQPGGVSYFRIVGRVGDLSFPEWNQRYGLYDGQPCPPSRWRSALFTALVLPPLGVLALVYSWQVQTLYRRGDYKGSLWASQGVRSLCRASTTLACVVGLSAAGYLSASWIWGNVPEAGERSQISRTSFPIKRLPPS